MNNEIIERGYHQISKPLPRLATSQRDLYDLIYETCLLGGMLETKKAFEVYKKHGKGKGWSKRYNHDTKQWVDIMEKWGEWQWKSNFKIWLFHTLGALVIKGYLKIMPSIDFSEFTDKKND
jgi:hypothetical protein